MCYHNTYRSHAPAPSTASWPTLVWPNRRSAAPLAVGRRKLFLYFVSLGRERAPLLGEEAADIGDTERTRVGGENLGGKQCRVYAISFVTSNMSVIGRISVIVR